MIAGIPLSQILGQRRCVQAMLAAAVAVAALLAVVLDLWQPAVHRYSQTEAMRGRLIAEMTSLQEQGRIAVQFEERRKQADLLEAKLSSDITGPDFIRAIEELTAKSGVTLVQISSQPVREDNSGMRPEFFECSLRGNYAAFRGFISSIHALPAFVTIERTVFERSDDTLRVRMVLKRLAKT